MHRDEVARSVVRGLSVLVAAYPARPSLRRQRGMGRLLRVLFGVMVDTPAVRIAPRRGRIPRAALLNRHLLTQFLRPRAKLWFGASDAVGEPRRWGPIVWRMIHALKHIHQPHRHKHFVLFLELLADLLPCPKCRKSFRRILVKARGLAKRGNQTENFASLCSHLHNQVTAHVKGKNK